MSGMDFSLLHFFLIDIQILDILCGRISKVKRKACRPVTIFFFLLVKFRQKETFALTAGGVLLVFSSFDESMKNSGQSTGIDL